jgi:hypothetical protein
MVAFLYMLSLQVHADRDTPQSAREHGRFAQAKRVTERQN